MSIRSHYESLGVQNYYKSFGSEYKNPHAHLLTSILCQLLSDQTKFGSDLVTILDFACGSGEGIVALTSAFKTLGLNSNIILDISDPYTLPAFHQERLINPLPANVQLRDQFKWTFEELSHSDSMLSKYDIVISSFALHCRIFLINTSGSIMSIFSIIQLIPTL